MVVTGWLARPEREVIVYLIEENRCLRRQLGGRRVRLTDDDRRRLSARAYRVGRRALRDIATIATPDTLLLRGAIDDSARPQGSRSPARAAPADVMADALKAHWGVIAAADFFTSEVWTWRGLVTFYTVFVMDLASRRVQIVGSTPHPNDLFMHQVSRTLTAADAGLLPSPPPADLRSRSEMQ